MITAELILSLGKVLDLHFFSVFPEPHEIPQSAAPQSNWLPAVQQPHILNGRRCSKDTQNPWRQVVLLNVELFPRQPALLRSPDIIKSYCMVYAKEKTLF